MYNKVFLIGNLAKDPELRYTPAGVATARFAVAVNRIQKGDGRDVDFIPVVAWRKLAEICGEYLKKGRPVAVEGKLQVRTFKGRDGEQRTIAEVVLENMQMLGKRPDSAPGTSQEKEESKTQEESPF